MPLPEEYQLDEAFREWYKLQLQANIWRHKASARFPMTAYELMQNLILEISA